MNKPYKTNDAFSVVNEAVQAYVKGMGSNAPYSGSAAQLTYNTFLQNKMLIIHTIRKGIPYNLFQHIQQITPFSEHDWSVYLSLSTKTLQRNSVMANFHFKPIHSEKIIEIAEVTNYGHQVFNSKDQFYLWLNTPCLALGKYTPFELLKDSYGKEMVMAELNRIEHGIFA